MKRTVWKSAFALLICLLFVLTGCIGKQEPAANDNTQQILAELEAMKQQLDATKTEISAMKTDDKKPAEVVATPTEAPEEVVIEVEVPVDSVYGVNCTVNGGDSVPLDGNTKVHAVANEIEGFEFDHWAFGEELDYESGPDATFYFSEPTVLHAEYHKHRVVKFINCHMNLLNEKGKATGKDYKEYDFEDEATAIDFFVTADVPKGKQVAYWLINDVKYQPTSNVVKFRVWGQSEATVYEVVFENEPTVYYNVTCHNCTFSGGSYSGATSGKVKAGTPVTFYGKSHANAADFYGNPSISVYPSYYKDDGNYCYYKFSYTVNSDTEVWFREGIM